MGNRGTDAGTGRHGDTGEESTRRQGDAETRGCVMPVGFHSPSPVSLSACPRVRAVLRVSPSQRLRVPVSGRFRVSVSSFPGLVIPLRETRAIIDFRHHNVLVFSNKSRI